MYKKQWTHTPVDLTEKQMKQIDFEISTFDDDLDQPGDLIFHTVMLTDDMQGPIVLITGEPEHPDTYFLTYYENPEWTTLNNIN